MPILNWIGKEAVVNHDKEVPFKLLKKVKSLSYGENSQNLIIHGDNLEALKALMPYYQGQVKCIYIDPPYNTGNEGWVYNDRVNSPKIKKWLGKVVGSESEDLCRHDKWLCMMYPRLKLLKDLLSDDGVIFVSIDDNELYNLKQLMDEILGGNNFIVNFIRKNKSGSGHDSSNIAIEFDYMICYSKNNTLLQFNKEKIDVEEDKKYKYEDDSVKKRGKYYLRDLDYKGSFSPSLDYEIKAPDGSIILAGKKKGKPNTWRWSKDKVEWGEKNGFIIFKEVKKEWKVYIKQYQFVDNEDNRRERELPYRALVNFSNSEGSHEVKNILIENDLFSYPKPISLVKFVLKLITDKNSLILDSFAGSGTTGHAVLDLNKEDGGNRKFILVELEDKVAKEVTVERIKKSIEKYDYKADFEYCELDKPLFNEDGQIEQECTFEQLANYIYFTETNTNIDKKIIFKEFIGEYNNTEYYLIFKEKGKNILSKEFIKKLQKDNKKKVIYADKCFIDERTLEKNRIQFKQIPYEVKVY